MNANTNSASPSGPPGSEAEVNWEERYQLGDTPWDKGVASPPLTDFLTRHQVLGEVLVPGCGTGHDVRALASQGASVLGLDLAKSAIAQALSRSPLGKETYSLGDLFALPSSWQCRFDWVVEHTCFCAIPLSRRIDYVNAISGIIKPSGYFLAIFFTNPDTEQGPPFGVSREEIAQLFDPGFELIEEWVPSQTYAGREGRELCQLRRGKM